MSQKAGLLVYYSVVVLKSFPNPTPVDLHTCGVAPALTMDADDFEALFGAPPPPQQQQPPPPQQPSKPKKKDKKSKKSVRKKKTSNVVSTSNANAASNARGDYSLGPLSPKATASSSRKVPAGHPASRFFQAALLVTLKRTPKTESSSSSSSSSSRSTTSTSTSTSTTTRTTSTIIVPVVSQCFPKDQLAKLPARIEHFCFPDARTMVPLERQAATSFTFVLTAVSGDRTYGYCRRYLPSSATSHQIRHDVGKRYPECLCILSSYPYFSMFDYVLKTLQIRRWLAPSSMAPFLKEFYQLDMPCKGERFKIHQSIFLRPNDDRLPLTAQGVRTLFTRFTPSLVRHILGAVLLERRVIFHSVSVGVLSRVIWTVLSLLYPFEWQHILIPLLPDNLLEYDEENCCFFIFIVILLFLFISLHNINIVIRLLFHVLTLLENEKQFYFFNLFFFISYLFFLSFFLSGTHAHHHHMLLEFTHQM